MPGDCQTFTEQARPPIDRAPLDVQGYYRDGRVFPNLQRQPQGRNRMQIRCSVVAKASAHKPPCRWWTDTREKLCPAQATPIRTMKPPNKPHRRRRQYAARGRAPRLQMTAISPTSPRWCLLAACVGNAGRRRSNNSLLPLQNRRNHLLRSKPAVHAACEHDAARPVYIPLRRPRW